MYIDMKVNGINIEVLDGVYSPGDDTFLILDVIEEINVNGLKCIDVCCGTGVIGLKLLLKGASLVLFTDINAAAVKNSILNYQLNREKILGTALFSLGDCLEHIKLGRFNLIACNPPYLPVNEDIRWSGGRVEGGLRIAEKIVNKISEEKFKGETFVVLSTLSDSAKFERIVENERLQWDIVAERAFFYERIRVYRISR